MIVARHLPWLFFADYEIAKWCWERTTFAVPSLSSLTCARSVSSSQIFHLLDCKLLEIFWDWFIWNHIVCLAFARFNPHWALSNRLSMRERLSLSSLLHCTSAQPIQGQGRFCCLLLRAAELKRNPHHSRSADHGRFVGYRVSSAYSWCSAVEAASLCLIFRSLVNRASKSRQHQG